LPKKPKSTPKPLSLRAYARRRDVSHEAVRRAIESGRLERSVVLVKGEPKITDPELADHEWEANTRPTSMAAPPAEPLDARDDLIDFAEARRRREVELWRQARLKREGDELDLAKRKGELVSVGEARGAVIEKFSVVKTKMLGLPVRVKQRLPHLAAQDIRMIDDLVREALEALADGHG
jgi:hypothetical protein